MVRATESGARREMENALDISRSSAFSFGRCARERRIGESIFHRRISFCRFRKETFPLSLGRPVTLMSDVHSIAVRAAVWLSHTRARLIARRFSFEFLSRTFVYGMRRPTETDSIASQSVACGITPKRNRQQNKLIVCDTIESNVFVIRRLNWGSFSSLE